MLVMWIGFIIYQIGFNDGRLSWIFYVAMILFTLFILVADFMMNKYFVIDLVEVKWASILRL